MEEAFQEWIKRGKPKDGKCGSPAGPGPGCNQKTIYEYKMQQEDNQYMYQFWKAILYGDGALGVVGTMGALGWFGGAGAATGAAGGAEPIPFPKPNPAPPPAVPLKPAA